MDVGNLGLAAFILTAIGWLSREIWRWRKAKRLATEDATKTLNQKRALLQELISQAEGTDSKQILLTQLEEVNAALLGLYAERLRHTLRDAGLPAEEMLIANGQKQLKPQEAAKLERTIAEVNVLPPLLSTRDLLDLGSAYYLLERYEEAKNIYSRILDITPYDHDAFQYRGATYFRLKKYKEALTDFNRALELRPNDPNAIHDQGVVFRSLKKYKEALTDFNRALELRPDHPTILDNRGTTYAKLERYDEALADYNRALELKPDDSDTLCNRGTTYAKLERYDEALADYNRALELKPDDPDTPFNLACLFSLWGKTDDALTYLEKAIKLDKKCREDAKTDKDFDNIRDGPRFKKLIEPD